MKKKYLDFMNELVQVGKKSGFVTYKQVERIIPKKLRTEKKVE